MDARRENLHSFLVVIGPWTGREVSVPSEQLAVLGPGDFLAHDYRHSAGLRINLFLAYYLSQRSGDTIHSPQNYLLGSGWTAVRSGRIQMQRAGDSCITVNRIVVGKGLDRVMARRT